MKPITTEKAVMSIEKDNLLTFEFDMRKTKKEIRDEIEKTLDVKIDRIRTQIRDNKKIAFAKLNKNFLAIDLATKLGMM